MSNSDRNNLIIGNIENQNPPIENQNPPIENLNQTNENLNQTNEVDSKDLNVEQQEKLLNKSQEENPQKKRKFKNFEIRKKRNFHFSGYCISAFTFLLQFLSSFYSILFDLTFFVFGIILYAQGSSNSQQCKTQITNFLIYVGVCHLVNFFFGIFITCSHILEHIPYLKIFTFFLRKKNFFSTLESEGENDDEGIDSEDDNPENSLVSNEEDDEEFFDNETVLEKEKEKERAKEEEKMEIKRSDSRKIKVAGRRRRRSLKIKIYWLSGCIYCLKSIVVSVYIALLITLTVFYSLDLNKPECQKDWLNNVKIFIILDWSFFAISVCCVGSSCFFVNFYLLLRFLFYCCCGKKDYSKDEKSLNL